LSSNVALGLNRTIPIKFQLTDYSGNSISSLGAVTALQVLNAQGTDVLAAAGKTGLRSDSKANQFIYNWQDKGLAAGSYAVRLALADGTVKTKVVQLSATGSMALTIDAAGVNGSGTGALLGGDVELYVDNAGGNLNADELARIQDAVTAVDAVVAPY